jgi:hypothetical protein
MRFAPLSVGLVTLTLAASTLATLTLATPAFAGSETPPVGPPWTRSLVEAQQAALERRVPIFVYFTKTH